MQLTLFEPVRDCLQRHDSAADHWLWCVECTRFFHLKSVRYERGTAHCPFADCHGLGLDFNLFYWDTEREPDDPRWPTSTEQLRHGMTSPDMEEFYAARQRRRIEELIAAFHGSPEHRALGRPNKIRFVGQFLQMLYDLCWDIDDPFFTEDLARELPGDLALWCPTVRAADADRIEAELSAFWAFADRESALPHAERWRRIFAIEHTAELLRAGIDAAVQARAGRERARRRRAGSQRRADKRRRRARKAS